MKDQKKKKTWKEKILVYKFKLSISLLKLLSIKIIVSHQPNNFYYSFYVILIQQVQRNRNLILFIKCYDYNETIVVSVVEWWISTWTFKGILQIYNLPIHFVWVCVYLSFTYIHPDKYTRRKKRWNMSWYLSHQLFQSFWATENLHKWYKNT
jgi:hypothetical protein